jgi:hypothetical protein
MYLGKASEEQAHLKWAYHVSKTTLIHNLPLEQVSQNFFSIAI